MELFSWEKNAEKDKTHTRTARGERATEVGSPPGNLRLSKSTHHHHHSREEETEDIGHLHSRRR